MQLIERIVTTDNLEAAWKWMRNSVGIAKNMICSMDGL
jgi:hypothetical protein